MAASKERIEITNFKKVNRAVDPTLIDTEEFTIKENFINKPGYFGKAVKRSGIQRHNSNALSSEVILNLFEAKFDSGYYLVAKDSIGSSGAVLKYLTSPYTGSWNTISSAQEANHYNFLQTKNNVYLANILNDSDVLQVNKVWQGSTNIFEMGCLPTDTDTYTLVVAAGGYLTTAYWYWYIVTNVYDNYQESACFEPLRIYLSGAGTAVYFSNIPAVPNSRVKARKIYRSAKVTTAIGVGVPLFYAPPPSEFYYLTTIYSTGSSTYTDIKADSDLGSAISTEIFFDQKRPYKSKLHTIANDRLIQANLETNPLRYSAITTGNIALASANSTGTLTNSGVYKYRFFKAYAQHSGGFFTYTVGINTNKTITLGGADDTVSIVLSNLTSDFDNWCNYVYVERTVAGGSDYYPLAVFKKADTYVDLFSDTQLKGASFPIKITKVEGTPVGQSKFDVVDSSKFKNSIAISESGTPDLIPAENIKLIDSKDSRGITGIYSEDSGVVLFTSSAIHFMDTRAISSEFWTIDKVIDGIGAMGQDTSPSTESDGHNGILQLPDNLGYIFFNRAYSGSALNEIKIYFYDRKNEPVIISNEINSYLQGASSFYVYGMCYDKINKWVWCSVYTGTQYIMVYDLEFKEWYVFTFGNSAVIFYDIICTEDGKIFLGGQGGFLYNYLTTSNQDNYSGSTYNFTARLQSKTFDFFDENINAVMIQFNLLTASATTTSSDITMGINDASTITYSAQASSSSVIHKIKKKFNLLVNRLYFKFENAENKNIVVEKISLDIKRRHKKSGGTI